MGGVLALGFAWYLAASPRFSLLGYALPWLHLGGAVAVQRRLPLVAWLLLVPHAGVAAYLAAVVLSQ